MCIGGDVFNSIEGLQGGAGADTLTGNASANILLGEDGADSISAGAGTDSVDGGLGSDTLSGGAGADSFYGGGEWWEGFDYVSYAGASSGVAASLTTHAWGGAGTGTAGDAAGDILERVEGLIGSSFNDTLGSNGGVSGVAWGFPDIPHRLIGGAGNDVYVLEEPWGPNLNGWVEVVEAAGQGVDEMRTSTRSTLTLAANVENLTNR